MLELISVSKRFGEVHALAGVNLEVPAGETTVLLGTSGCGKSTLLRALVGLVVPDEGEIRVRGNRLHAAEVATLRANTGYVIQGGGLFPHLTAFDNAALAGETAGFSSSRIAERIEVLREMTKLPKGCLARYPAELSGGQRQRVSLLRALMRDPEVLLLDEPLGALDPITRYDLQVELQSLFAELHKTVVLVTHDLGEAAFLGDRLVLMQDGQIVQTGQAADLVQRPKNAWVEKFVQSQRSLGLPDGEKGPS